MPTSDYAPSTQDVARFVRSRTRDAMGNYVTSADSNGNQVPDFSSVTNPDVDSVSGLIADALDEMADAIGSDIEQQYWPTAKRAATLLTAANIELSYAADQAGERNSVYDKLFSRYNSLVSSLQEDIGENAVEEASDEVLPSFDNTIPTGWDSVRW